MSRKAATLCLLFITTISLTKADDDIQASRTVYDVLESYGLPRGLLPENVTRYQFNSKSGNLFVTLPNLKEGQVCSVTRTVSAFGIDIVYNRVDLQPTISALVLRNKLYKIEGIRATVFVMPIINFFNIKITEVRVVRNTLQFISPDAKSPAFPIMESFNTPQKCEIRTTYSALPGVFRNGVVENNLVDDIPMIVDNGGRALLGRKA